MFTFPEPVGNVKLSKMSMYWFSPTANTVEFTFGPDQHNPSHIVGKILTNNEVTSNTVSCRYFGTQDIDKCYSYQLHLSTWHCGRNGIDSTGYIRMVHDIGYDGSSIARRTTTRVLNMTIR
jgi:hypothetical protein